MLVFSILVGMMIVTVLMILVDACVLMSVLVDATLNDPMSISLSMFLMILV